MELGSSDATCLPGSHHRESLVSSVQRVLQLLTFNYPRIHSLTAFFFFFENQSIKKNTSLNKSTLKHFKCTPLGSESPQRTFLAPSVPVWMVGIYSPEKFAHMGNFHPCVLRKRKQVSDLIETDGNTYRNGRMCVFMLPFYLN